MTATTATAATPTLTTWAVDASHSHAEFAVRHMMIATVKGRFGDVQGTVRLDEGNLAASAVDVTLGVASIDTREPQRDEHLRSPDFFDAAAHPRIAFRSTRIEGTKDRFALTGDLTIRGITRPVTLQVTAEGRGRDPWGNERAGFSASGTIKRSEFGLTWNQALETGGVLVSDEVKISLDVELVRQEG